MPRVILVKGYKRFYTFCGDVTQTVLCRISDNVYKTPCTKYAIFQFYSSVLYMFFGTANEPGPPKGLVSHIFASFEDLMPFSERNICISYQFLIRLDALANSSGAICLPIFFNWISENPKFLVLSKMSTYICRLIT